MTVAVSTQVWTPVVHEVVPARQTFGFPEQPRPAVQVEHTPPLQTWFAPQAVPFATGVPFTHAEVPVEQLVTPAWHSGSGCPLQVRPAVHETQAPPLQTWSAPHVVPFVFAAPFTQTDVPVAQLVTPSWQAVSGLVEQASPAVQPTQAPPLQTRFAPQAVPFVFAAPSTQTDVPVAQLVTPSWQAVSGLVEQATFAVQATQTPPLQTWFVPQSVPSPTLPVSVQIATPVSQLVSAVWQTLVVDSQTTPGVQMTKSKSAVMVPFVPHSTVKVPAIRSGPSTGVPT
jgi:hypothetical protein